MQEERNHHAVVTLVKGYQFVAEFPDTDGQRAILLDEPQPLGDNRGPNAAALLGAAVGDCLAASLTLCLRKSRATVECMTASVTTHVARNDAGRFRISGIDVELTPEIGLESRERLQRCGTLFEEFCIVTESVRHGIDVRVSVKGVNQEASDHAA
jgi:uncharacterized OsmC-like protein